MSLSVQIKRHHVLFSCRWLRRQIYQQSWCRSFNHHSPSIVHNNHRLDGIQVPQIFHILWLHPAHRHTQHAWLYLQSSTTIRTITQCRCEVTSHIYSTYIWCNSTITIRGHKHSTVTSRNHHPTRDCRIITILRQRCRCNPSLTFHRSNRIPRTTCSKHHNPSWRTALDIPTMPCVTTLATWSYIFNPTHPISRAPLHDLSREPFFIFEMVENQLSSTVLCMLSVLLYRPLSHPLPRWNMQPSSKLVKMAHGYAPYFILWGILSPPQLFFAIINAPKASHGIPSSPNAPRVSIWDFTGYVIAFNKANLLSLGARASITLPISSRKLFQFTYIRRLRHFLYIFLQLKAVPISQRKLFALQNIAHESQRTMNKPITMNICSPIPSHP